MSFEDGQPADECPKFPSPEEADHQEQLRAYVIRQLAAGKTCSEIEDAFIQQGYPVEFAVDFVERIYGKGKYDGEVTGTLIKYNDGTMVEFHEDMTSKRRRRAADRQRREISRAREGEQPSVDPGLIEVNTTFSHELLRQRRDQSRVFGVAIVIVVLSVIAMSGMLYLLAR